MSQKYPSVLQFFLSQPESYIARERLKTQQTNNETDRNFHCTVLNCVEYARNQEVKSYVVSESLRDALNIVDCEEVGPWHLEGTQISHFIFKQDAISDGENSYNEMFINILPPKEIYGLYKNFSEDQYKICISLATSVNKNGGTHVPVCFIGARYKEGSTLNEIMETCRKDLDGSMKLGQEFKEECIRLALNLILYKNSPDPDILRLKPHIWNTRYFREQYFPKCKNEQALFGIFSMGWDFHGREYTVGLTVRKGHPRWQPCGPKWSQRKLIFLMPTTVTYKNYTKGD